MILRARNGERTGSVVPFCMSVYTTFIAAREGKDIAVV